jgi:hypothetical protein
MVFVLFVGPIWFLSHHLVSSGAFLRILRDYTSLEEDFFMQDSPIDNAHQLSRLYDAIYGSLAAMVESDRTRTLLWLTFAMLLNLICITIEMQLFQEQIGE